MSKGLKIALAVVAFTAAATTAFLGLGGLEPPELPDLVEARTAVVPTGAPTFHNRDWDAWNRAYEYAGLWSTDAAQTRDPELRADALREIERSLFDQDAVRVLAGLLAIPKLGKVEFDRRRMRERVVEILGAEDASLRWGALAAFRGVRMGPEILDTVLPMTEDPNPSVRVLAGTWIVRLTRGDLTGESSEPLMRLLSDKARPCILETLAALKATRRLSDPLVDRLLELTRAEHHTAKRRAIDALEGLEEKPERVVARLDELTRSRNAELWRRAVAKLGGLEPGPAVDRFVETLRDGYHEERRNAVMALRGVPDAQKDRVADRLLALLGTTREPVVMSFCLDLLAMHGTDRHLAGVEAWAAREEVSESQRAWAADAVEKMRNR